MRKNALRHLTTEQHEEAAKLINQVQDNLGDLARLVARGPFTDELLRIRRAVQEILIDPLREAWDADRERDLHDNPYGSTHYAARGGRSLPRPAA